jgi:hypothetical protein
MFPILLIVSAPFAQPHAKIIAPIGGATVPCNVALLSTGVGIQSRIAPILQTVLQELTEITEVNHLIDLPRITRMNADPTKVGARYPYRARS